MGFFDSLNSFVGSNSDAIGFGMKAVDTGLSLYSGYETKKANEEAARGIVEANNRNAEAVEAANRDAQERFERLAADGQPGVTYLKRLASNDPYQLTPGQEQSLAENRREAVNSLSRSGLRGSGRAVTAALKEVDSDLRNNYVNSNLSRSDQAAGQLAGISTTANRASADYGVDAARYGTGNLASSADVTGGADIANQELGNSGLADINSAVASLVKEGRKSRYFSSDDTEKEVI